jgi:hypothetical protein
LETTAGTASTAGTTIAPATLGSELVREQCQDEEGENRKTQVATASESLTRHAMVPCQNGGKVKSDAGDLNIGKITREFGFCQLFQGL